jgi:hypothetical protein
MVTYVAMADALEFMEYDQSTSAEKDEFYKNPWIRFEGIECNFFTPCNDDSREWDTNQDAAGWWQRVWGAAAATAAAAVMEEAAKAIAAAKAMAAAAAMAAVAATEAVAAMEAAAVMEEAVKAMAAAGLFRNDVASREQDERVREIKAEAYDA